MALPILDGNQSATTLSTIFTSGAHIPSHTVVSFGTQAIADISSAVSGISVSIGGTQTTTFGAVTGSISVLNFPSVQSVSGAVTANVFNLSPFVMGNVVSTFVLASGNTGALIGIESFRGFSIDIGAGGGTQTVLAEWSDNNFVTATTLSWVKIDGVTGTTFSPNSDIYFFALPTNLGGFSNNAFRLRSISGNGSHAFTVREIPFNQPVSGTVTIGNTVTVSQSAAITVGALPSGALTTRFGSVTTANLSQITTAVTNTSRKYLLAQNISAGTVTIGIGFSPTTTQGIQLTAGAGLTFDAFCPTGAVYWLGAVTGAAWTILEG